MDRYAHFAFVAAREALADANFPDDADVRARTGSIVASGIGGIITVEDTVVAVAPNTAWDRISPFFVPMLMSNAAAAHISMAHGLRGPVFSVASACASSNDAFAVAFDKIALGQAIAVVTGGSEATVMPTAMGGFDSMKALSRRNDEPERASRPFDLQRDGFVLGEGSAILVLEEREFALARGARIYAEVLGLRTIGRRVSHRAARSRIARRDPRDGTRARKQRHQQRTRRLRQRARHVDAARRSRRIASDRNRVRRPRVRSSRSARPNRCTATCSARPVRSKASACALALYHGILPPTINYEFPDPECRLDYVPNVARDAQVDVAISNGFGFGGHNSTVVFARHVVPA